MSSVEPEPAAVQRAGDADVAYPASPTGPLPSVDATRAFKVRVAFVLASLLLFVAVYFGLMASLVWAAHAALFRGGFFLEHERFVVWRGIFAAIAGALFLFLAKGLFHRERAPVHDYLEIDATTQPRFFAFLRRLCAESGSPMPAKVYLSCDVNAGVFYRRSLINLVWPTPKNLVVGAGLITALDVAELKGVLGHEFGHFGQASMKLGQYVYTLNAVVRNVVYGRDRFDQMLRNARGFDYRMMAAAYVVEGAVAVLRKLIEQLFRLMNLASFSLGRQMEFDADLMAVRLAGSDAIVSGLWKSERATLAYDHAVGGLRSLAQHGLFSRNVFFHQARSLARLDGLIKHERGAAEQLVHVLSPYRPGPALHYASPEKAVGTLWATHPPKHEREANAKRLYVPSPTDATSAWRLFDDRRKLREALSRVLYGELGFEPGPMQEPAEVEAAVEEERGEMRQAPRYHGMYEGRLVAISDLEAMFVELDRAPLDPAELRASAAAVTGRDLEQLMDRRRALESAQSLVEGLRDGSLKLPEKTVDALGAPRTRDELLGLTHVVEAELEGSDERLGAVDRAVLRHFYARTVDDPAARAELVERYRFLNLVQSLLAGLKQFGPGVSGMLEAFAKEQPLGEAGAGYSWQLFTGLWGALAQAGNTLASAPAPAMAMIAPGTTLDRFVLPGGLVAPLASMPIPAPWLGELLKSYAVAMARLAKLRVKNLGSLLALEERLDPTLFPDVGAAGSIRPEAPIDADD